MSKVYIEAMHPDTKALIEHYQLEPLPVEGTLFTSTYRSSLETGDGAPFGTAMIGLYSDDPFSVSCFHRLPSDEIWHVYGGDPFKLILLYPDSSSEEILMGLNPLENQHVQFVVPANVWQAGYMLPNGRYSLFGCTMAPGFTSAGFEAGIANDLIVQYPTRAADILRLSVNGHQMRMPTGFAI
jgi:predicted cupin superfamily sugar epimerase